MTPRTRSHHAGAQTRRTILAAVTTVLVTLSGCSATLRASAPSTTSATSAKSGSTAAEPSTARAAGVDALDWHSCDDAPAPAECATLQVPVDYAKPDGEKLGIALLREKATSPSKRIGPLLMNPGGPGGSGIDLLLGRPWSPQISSHFDLVGFDPRGVGRSAPLECHDTLEQMYSVDPAPRTPAAVDTLLSASKTFVKGCADKYASLLPHLGTRDVARDMDQIRVALGEKQISYLGFSYGTSIGQVYADLFPTHVRAMVLDGVVKLGESGLEAARSQGIAFDKALDDFFAAAKATPAWNLPDPEGAFDKIQAALKVAPIPTNDAKRPLPAGLFQLGVTQALYAEQLWPNLARGLSLAADDNDGTYLLMLADNYLNRSPDGTFTNAFEIYFAVSCLDWSWPKDPAAYLTAGQDVAKVAPHLAEGTITDYVRCAYWPTPPQPLTPPKAKGSPTIVVVSTTGDPATPYVNGVELAKMLPKGVLITKVGSTHTAYGDGDACIEGPVNAYLVSLRKPAANTRCPDR